MQGKKDILEFDVIKKLPDHLKQFIVDQQYDKYTPIDHAVWRYVMRLSYNFLSQHAHPAYIIGLKNSGINLEYIPNIYEMNTILSKIGWGAICVDGFIPPASFMEFQAHKVLVIAADIRHYSQIEYTPAPDIIHEAAGHAPIIDNPEYREYLQLFGEIGSKAIQHPLDTELYEAIRHLSIIKGNKASSEKNITEAIKQIQKIKNMMHTPSEIARIRNLHWWTVEYGLIGTLKNPKIYGAGLLSSIGESISCLSNRVKKIPYSIEAADFDFDITTKQPQLFVTPNFKFLTKVLNEFSKTMAFRVGGLESIKKAIKSETINTCQLTSGLQISGNFTDVINDENNNPVYIKINGPAILCEDNILIKGHGKDYHQQGYSTPVGKIIGFDAPLEKLTISDLQQHQIIKGKKVILNYESSLEVEGILQKITVNKKGKAMLLTFSDCSVIYKNQVLFKPMWGNFDLGIGERIESVFSGPADTKAYGLLNAVPEEKTHRKPITTRSLKKHAIYQKVRDIREGKIDKAALENLIEVILKKYKNEPLLLLEIYELLDYKSLSDEIKEKVIISINELKNKDNLSYHLISNRMMITEVY